MRPGLRLTGARLLILLVLLPAGLTGCRMTDDPHDLAATPAGAAVLQRNLASESVLPTATIDSLLVTEADLPVGLRVGAWARRFLAADAIRYRFGPADGGYVALGLLVHDRHHDCVSLMYRCTELAGAVDHRDAMVRALHTRFAGAPLEGLVDEQGRVDYEHPAHLDFSLDMIRSGYWGRDITPTLAGAVGDSAGSARYEPGSFDYLPSPVVGAADLREGDIAWLVLDPRHQRGARLRREYGLVIGHIGIVIEKDGAPWLVHAASADLPGWYEGDTVVEVPLQDYLQRVEQFCGVMITRMKDADRD